MKLIAPIADKANRKVSQALEQREEKEEAKNFNLFYQAFGFNVEAHQSQWEEYFKSKKARIAAPRNSGKTTFTIFRIAWEIGRKPEIRILLIGCTDDVAIAISTGIRSVIESEEYQRIFPWIKKSRRWADRKWSINRRAAGVKGFIKDPTLSAVGIRGSLVSKRADLIVVEDPIKSQEAIESPKVRETMRRWWRVTAAPCLEPTGQIWVLCTRYRVDDIHGTTFNAKSGFKILTQPALIAGEEGEEVSYWPGKFPVELLQEIREEDPIAFSSQYQNEPIAEESVIIRPEWIKRGEMPAEFDAIAIGIDFAASLKEKNDYTALVAAGRKGKQYFIVKCLRGRWTIHQTALILFDLYEELETKTKRIECRPEAVGMQAAFTHEFRRLAIEMRKLINIKDDETKGSKEQRLRGISGLFEAGLVYFNIEEDLSILTTELVGFGSQAHDDTADSMEKALRNVFKAKKPVTPGEGYR